MLLRMGLLPRRPAAAAMITDALAKDRVRDLSRVRESHAMAKRSLAISAPRRRSLRPVVRRRRRGRGRAGGGEARPAAQHARGAGHPVVGDPRVRRGRREEGRRASQPDGRAPRPGGRRGLVDALREERPARPVLAQQELHLDRRRPRDRRGQADARRHRARRVPGGRARGAERQPEGDARARPADDVDGPARARRSRASRSTPRRACRSSSSRCRSRTSRGRTSSTTRRRPTCSRRSCRRSPARACSTTCGRGCSSRSASRTRPGTPTSTASRSAASACACARRTSRASASSTCRRASGRASSCCRPAWIEAATSRQVSNGSNPESDWEQGYGYQFWRCRHGFYRGDGAFGQFCIVMPEQDAVVAITSGTRDMASVMNLVWEHLLPAMQPARARGRRARRSRRSPASSRRCRCRRSRASATSPLAREIAGRRFALPGQRASGSSRWRSRSIAAP